MRFLIECAIKAAVVAAAGLIAAGFCRKRSASVRHWVLASSTIAVGLVPLASWLLPAWNIVPFGGADLFQVSVQASASSAGLFWHGGRDGASISAASWVLPQLPFIAWLTGAAIGSVYLLVGWTRLARFARCSAHVVLPPNVMECPRRVRLLQSPRPSMLVTWGVVRPTVLLPAGFCEWPSDRIESALSHEFAHIRRADWVLQTIAEMLRVAYWFNPLMWMLCRRLRLESEYACDDAVIGRGIPATRYAAHLLDVVHALNENKTRCSAALAMARPSTVERRFTAMLNPKVSRNPVSRNTMIATIAATLSIMLPLAAIGSSPVVESSSQRIVGTVSDTAGKNVSNATVVVSTPAGRTQGVTTTNAQGSYTYKPSAAGPYVIQVFAPGFGPSALSNVDATADKDVRRDVTMDIGFVAPEPQAAATKYTGDLVSLDLKDYSLKDFFVLISKYSGLNIVLDPGVEGIITVRLSDVPWDQALDTVLKNYRLRGDVLGNVLRVSKDIPRDPEMFTLNLELYRDGKLLGKPQVSVLDTGTATLRQGDSDLNRFTIWLTPRRLPDGTIAVLLRLMTGQKQVQEGFNVSDGEGKTFGAANGSNSIEVRFSVQGRR